MTKNKVRVLMVEDNAMDALLASEILSESSRSFYEVFIVENAFKALKFLHRTNAYEKAFRPDVIILDLNLPGLHGFDFLREVKADDELKTIPVCILTTSNSNHDIRKSRELHAECYLTKPLDLDTFERTFAFIDTDGSNDEGRSSL